MDTEAKAQQTSPPPIYFHIDEHEQIWLNLNYIEPFPWGYFLSEEMVATLEL